MRIRSKVFLFSMFFALASGAVMAWCFLKIQQEEAAFVNSRRAIKTFAAVTDIEYFFVRQVRLLESYVLLGEESERLQLAQAFAQTRQRLDEWKDAVKKGEAHGAEIPMVQSVADAIAHPANKIRSLIAVGKRPQAMALVEKEFSPASAQALKKFDMLKRRVQDAKLHSEVLVVQELQRSHLGLLAGLGLVVFFGLVFLWALYNAVIRPIQNMRAWADRVARGEKGLAMTSFSGKNELTELAQSLGEMAIQLTRPKAIPAPLPPAPAPTATLVATATPARKPLSPSAPSGGSAPAPVGSAKVPAGTNAPVPAPPATSGERVPPPPPPPSVKDGFEDAVNEFREILTQMASKEQPKNR